MGTIRRHPPVQLFAAVTFNPVIEPEDVLKELEAHFGPVEEKSRKFEFDAFTDYYAEEMGVHLQKQFITFRELIVPEKLPGIKHLTNQIELRISGSEKRKVNIDPGYVSLSKVVLATTKDYSHRMYLGEGIFGDLHLVFTNKSFQIQPWTYPDYKQPWVIAFFNRLRDTYRQKLGEYFQD